MASVPSSNWRGPFRALISAQRGVAVVEFALIVPLLLLILLGVLAYGGYFWRAHALQQVANDAARAAVAGLTAAERRQLARATVNAELPGLAGLAAGRATVIITELTDTVTVELLYDAKAEAIFALGLVPMPNPVIRRTAAIRLGGL